MTKEELTKNQAREEKIQYYKTRIAEILERIKILSIPAIEDRDFLAQWEIEGLRFELYDDEQRLKALEN